MTYLDIRQSSRYRPVVERQGMAAQKPDLLQGTLDLLILKALAAGPLHGWAISKRIQQMSRDVLTATQGSLYPALYRLEDRGWVSGADAQSAEIRDGLVAGERVVLLGAAGLTEGGARPSLVVAPALSVAADRVRR